MHRQQKSIHDVYSRLSADGSEITGYMHERHKVGQCPWCDSVRVHHIVRDFMRRIDQTAYPVRELNMWSLGTSLKDTASNRRRMIHHWAILHDRMKRCNQWVPLFRVLERGRRGFLHFHVLVAEFVDHTRVLRIWRDITGENSNVNVRVGRGETEPLVRYLTKYLSKEGSTYRWMGPLYGLGSRSRRITTDGVEQDQFGGITCYEHVTRGYVERRDPQRRLEIEE